MSTGTGRGAEVSPTNLFKSQKGSILLEFAFSIGILMVIFMATVTFSFLYADCYGVQKVAREGAREASITGDTNWAGYKALQEAWLWGLDPGRMSVSFDQDGFAVTCYVSYTAAPFNRTFPRLLHGSPLGDYNLNASTTFVWRSSQ